MMLGVSLAIPALRSRTLLAETRALLAAMTGTPTPVRQALLNACIGTIKNASAWSNLGLLSVHMAHDAQASRLNWINPSGTAASLAGTPTPTHAVDRGYTGDAANAYLDYGLAWTALATQNDAHFGTYVAWGSANGGAAGQLTGNTVSLGRNGGAFQSRLQATTITTTGASNVPATAATHQCVTRVGPGSYDGYVDGVSIGTVSVASAAPGSGNITGLRHGAAFAPAAASLRAVHAGTGLTAQKIAAINSALATLAAAIGAN